MVSILFQVLYGVLGIEDLIYHSVTPALVILWMMCTKSLIVCIVGLILLFIDEISIQVSNIDLIFVGYHLYKGEISLLLLTGILSLLYKYILKKDRIPLISMCYISYLVYSIWSAISCLNPIYLVKKALGY